MKQISDLEEGFMIDRATGEILSMNWDFIIENYPNYYQSDIIAQEDDLECALSGDCDDEKLARIKRDWGETREEWEKAQDELLKEIQQRAYENYISIKKDVE